MEKLMKKGSKKQLGLAPGTLIHVGEQKMGKTQITLLDFESSGLTEKKIASLEEAIPIKEKPNTTTWINIDGLHDPSLVQIAGDHMGIHPLVLEDILNTGQRPKMEDHESYLFITLKMYQLDDAQIHPVAEQVSLIVGENYMLSFQEREGDVFEGVRNRLRAGKTKIRGLGPDYLMYALLDAVVDGYFIILEKLGDRIEVLEEDVLSSPSPETMKAIHQMKRETILLRKAIWPLREVVNNLNRSDTKLIGDHTRLYLKDLYDHTIQVMDTIESFRDVLAGLLDIYLSSVSNRMNNVMKVLTIFATIFMPLTFIAGIYGMNFETMPELHWKWGYPIILLIMFGMGIGMWRFFKKRGWL
ncbi:magnesium and cobalt transport protein CorA [bacterium F11]|nr:magnesium and cobalt transport protein CorA [bacterium F11]